MRFSHLFLTALALAGCSKTNSRPLDADPVRNGAHVSLEKRERYTLVTLQEGSPEETGREYALALRETSWASDVDAYLGEIVSGYSMLFGMPEEQFFAFLRSRADDLLPSLSEAHRTELLAFAAAGSDVPQSVANDGKLSEEEIVILNFFPEIVRPMACSAISVFGSLAPNGGNVVGRALDWESGRDGALNRINAVIVRKGAAGASVSLGFLGFLPVLTGVNSNGVFVAQFDSEYGAELVTSGRRSFGFDLRDAFEKARSTSDVTSALTAPSLRHPFAFNAIVADSRETVALENASPNDEHGTDVRTATSALNEGAVWEFPTAIAMVNSNVLKGHVDNHTVATSNTVRWEAFRSNLKKASQDGAVTLDEVEAMMTHHQDPEHIQSLMDGDVYNRSTQALTLWDASTKTLKVWFRTADEVRMPPMNPVFDEISLPW